MKVYDDLIIAMHNHPFFEELKKDLINLRPTIPTHNHKSDNTDDWKSKSAQQAGFDLCLQLFQIKPEK